MLFFVISLINDNINAKVIVTFLFLQTTRQIYLYDVESAFHIFFWKALFKTYNHLNRIFCQNNDNSNNNKVFREYKRSPLQQFPAKLALVKIFMYCRKIPPNLFRIE